MRKQIKREKDVKEKLCERGKDKNLKRNTRNEKLKDEIITEMIDKK